MGGIRKTYDIEFKRTAVAMYVGGQEHTSIQSRKNSGFFYFNDVVLIPELRTRTRLLSPLDDGLNWRMVVDIPHGGIDPFDLFSSTP
jgi:hypothetical protein